MADQGLTVFGIALGTTYSCIAHVDDSGRATVIPNAEGDQTTATPTPRVPDRRTVLAGIPRAAQGLPQRGVRTAQGWPGVSP